MKFHSFGQLGKSSSISITYTEMPSSQQQERRKQALLSNLSKTQSLATMITIQSQPKKPCAHWKTQLKGASRSTTAWSRTSNSRIRKVFSWTCVNITTWLGRTHSMCSLWLFWSSPNPLRERPISSVSPYTSKRSHSKWSIMIEHDRWKAIIASGRLDSISRSAGRKSRKGGRPKQPNLRPNSWPRKRSRAR